MIATIYKAGRISVTSNKVFLISDLKKIPGGILSDDEMKYAKTQVKNELICFNRISHWLFFQVLPKEKIQYKKLEKCRKAGDLLQVHLNKHKIIRIYLIEDEDLSEEILAYAEGMVLGGYQFLKYKTEKKQNSLTSVIIRSSKTDTKVINLLNILNEATAFCRNLVNEPVSFLNAEKLAEIFEKEALENNIKVEVLNKTKIEALRMGGLIAVNKGSIEPPTFTIMEWKPDKAINKKPIVLVGKGVVYDTGGLNIKTGNSMNDMKMDMAGAAMMGAAIIAIAKSKLPVYVIGLLPATDNRPDGNAYASGDVITMFDGTKVEVLNTDAEGRMILADALTYAKKYNPLLVINSATLTGAAARAIGKYGIVAMHANAEKEIRLLKQSGENVYERLAEFPFWDEYAELIKSEVGDIKNIGGESAGMITAGKFLQHFTKYPFIHLDIAGPAFLDKKDSYRTAGGTGTGVRLIFDFLIKKCKVNEQY